MKTKTEVLTEREKIVIAGAAVLALMGEKVTSKRMYQYAHPEGPQSERSIERHAGTFSQSVKVQDFQVKIQQAIKEQATQEITENERRKAKRSIEVGKVDFTNREEFIDFLNETANQITNEKDKRDYLKMIADLLRLKEDTTDKNGEIMKFYTPVVCSSCQIKAEISKIRSQKTLIQK